MFELQIEDIKPSNYSNFLCSLQAGCLSYIKAAFQTKFQPSMVLYALHRLSFPLNVEIVTNIIHFTDNLFIFTSVFNLSLLKYSFD